MSRRRLSFVFFGLDSVLVLGSDRPSLQRRTLIHSRTGSNSTKPAESQPVRQALRSASQDHKHVEKVITAMPEQQPPGGDTRRPIWSMARSTGVSQSTISLIWRVFGLRP